MGNCQACVTKEAVVINNEEILVRAFEDSIPSYPTPHVEWARNIRAVYDKDDVLNKEQFNKACLHSNFNIKWFVDRVGIAADGLLCDIVKIQPDTYFYKKVLQLSIMLTDDDESEVNTKIETFILSLCGQKGTSAHKTDFEDGVKFLLNLAIYIIPQGARSENIDQGTKLQRYIIALVSTIQPLCRTLSKMFYGTRLELPRDTLRNFLTISKEGRILMNSRRIRKFAFGKYESTLRIRKGDQKVDENGEL